MSGLGEWKFTIHDPTRVRTRLVLSGCSSESSDDSLYSSTVMCFGPVIGPNPDTSRWQCSTLAAAQDIIAAQRSSRDARNWRQISQAAAAPAVSRDTPQDRVRLYIVASPRRAALICSCRALLAGLAVKSCPSLRDNPLHAGRSHISDVRACARSASSARGITAC